MVSEPNDRQSARETAAAGKKPLPNLLLRLITGTIIGLAALAVTFCGGAAFQLFCLVGGALVLGEWHSITARRGHKAAQCFAWLFYAVFSLALLFGASSLRIAAVAALGAALSGGAALAGKGGKTALCQSGGFLYAAALPLSLCLLRGGMGQGALAGLYWVLLLYIIVWLSDVGAYICGRLCGGPKLCPRISPNKTWSGALGGAGFAVAGALIFVYLLRQSAILEQGEAVMAGFMPLAGVAALAVMLAVVAQCGDLAESWLKRRFGVKDSGRLLPGHGGVMDRVDGLLPAAAALSLFVAAAGRSLL